MTRIPNMHRPLTSWELTDEKWLGGDQFAVFDTERGAVLVATWYAKEDESVAITLGGERISLVTECADGPLSVPVSVDGRFIPVTTEPLMTTDLSFALAASLVAVRQSQEIALLKRDVAALKQRDPSVIADISPESRQSGKAAS